MLLERKPHWRLKAFFYSCVKRKKEEERTNEIEKNFKTERK
jgi:hypothetical protein